MILPHMMKKNIIKLTNEIVEVCVCVCVCIYIYIYIYLAHFFLCGDWTTLCTL